MAITVETDTGITCHGSAAGWSVEDDRLVIRNADGVGVAEYNQRCWVFVCVSTNEEK